MQDSFVELLKLLLPEIIVDYFELTSYKKGEELLHLYLKEINSIPKEYGSIPKPVERQKLSINIC